MRLLRWLVITVLVGGLAALGAVMIWFPANDPDSFALVQERTARLSAYRLKKPMPGAPSSAVPLEQQLAQAGFKLGAPVFMRIYKRSFELEVWMQRGERFALFQTYPICYFSGQLGPKLRAGDWQSPEGFYRIETSQLNPHSTHHRAFNIGFPNAYDKAHGYTGSLLEVHGGCSSVGCYAITDPAIADVYKLAAAALAAGQPGFQVQALPFRLTDDAMASHAKHPQAPFWEELKVVADDFDATHQPPDIEVCDGHYRLSRGGRGAGQASAPGACRRI